MMLLSVAGTLPESQVQKFVAMSKVDDFSDGLATLTDLEMGSQYLQHEPDGCRGRHHRSPRDTVSPARLHAERPTDSNDESKGQPRSCPADGALLSDFDALFLSRLDLTSPVQWPDKTGGGCPSFLVKYQSVTKAENSERQRWVKFLACMLVQTPAPWASLWENNQETSLCWEGSTCGHSSFAWPHREDS